MAASIDLSLLPAPDVVELLDYEVLFAERKAALIGAMPEEQREAIARTLELESEPLTKLLQENCYRELILRQRINEAARASMVAFATGADLDQLAANNNVKRLMLSAGDENAIPPIAPVYESDSNLRMRIPAAFEALSVAGPIGSYEYHARSADGRVSDASVISPLPAHVTVTVLSREGNGSAPADLIEKVDIALNDEDVRPVADRVTVQSAKIINYEIDAVIYCYPSPEYEPIMAAAEEQVKRYATQQHRLGRDIVLSAIYAALHVQGVQRVELKRPVADIKLDKTQASFCTQINVALGARMNSRLLPVGSSQLEIAAAESLAQIERVPIPIRELWNPDLCPVHLLPYLAWAFSVDRWDKDWSEKAKRDAVKAAMFIHKHKGTIGALRRVVEPLGYLIRVIEWWKSNETAGTFRLDIGVLETGITEEMYQELEALIFDAKPVSRHLVGLAIQLETRGEFYCGASSYTGDTLTVYAYTPPLISISGLNVQGAAIHLIDEMRINPQ